MSVKVWRPDDIVKHLRTIPAIAAIAPWWIFTRILAKSEEQLRNNYIIVRMVSDVVSWLSSDAVMRLKVMRCEFRFIWWTDTTTDETVLGMVQVMDETLLPDPCKKITNFNGFDVENIVESTAFWPNTTLLNKPIIIKDYLFSYYA